MPPKAVEGGGVIHITSPIEPGNLLLDGSAVGVTPLDVPAAPGRHEVEIEYPGGSHEKQSVDVARDVTVQVLFHPSGIDAAARPRKGLHFGVTAGPAMAEYLTGAFAGNALYGATASFVLNIGITPRFEFRAAGTVTFLSSLDHLKQFTAGVPALLKVNYTNWFSFMAGLSGGFATDLGGNGGFGGVNGYWIGPEWSAFTMGAGERHQYELSFIQGARFGTLDKELHHAVVFTYLFLD